MRNLKISYPSRALLLIVLLGVGRIFAAPPQEEADLAGTFIKQMVGLSRVALADMDPNRLGIRHNLVDHTHDADICYAMALLYKTPHSENPYHGDKTFRDQAIAMADHIVAVRLRPEWPLYVVSQVYSLLKDELPLEKRQAWEAYAEDYVRTEPERPLFRTAPNHEAISALAVFRAGQVFDKPEWMEKARTLMRRQLPRQTELGYFDEGIGPSMKYNEIQLTAMLLFHEYSGDPETLEASRKLADFMIRYSFPDGTPISTFDGRQDYALGYFGTVLYGMDRWPLGKEINRRIFRARLKRDVLDPHSRYYSYSNWYANFSTFFVPDEFRALRPDAPAKPLPQDLNGYRMVENGPSFAGGVIRRHDWMVALSAIRADPAFSGIYHLERQSRLDVWHPKTGLVIGGGHNMIGAEIPLANFVLAPADGSVQVDFGRIPGDRLKRRIVYYPGYVKASLDLDRQELTEVFSRGTTSLTVRPETENRLAIDYTYDVFGVKDTYVQLPLIVFREARLEIDGEAFQGGESAPVSKQIRIIDPQMGSETMLTLPPGAQARVHPSIEPLRWYTDENLPQRYEPYYRIALVSVKLDGAKGQGSGRFTLEIR